MADINHTDRAHARLSPSALHRWGTCTASPAFEEQFPDQGSEAAAEGTLAHELAEIKVQAAFFPDEMPKARAAREIDRLKQDPLWNNEMQGYTDDYLDFIKDTYAGYSSKPFLAVETRLDLTQWIPDGFGTADCILIGGNVLHIIDLKYGRGVKVDATRNPQLQAYALGAQAMYGILYPIDTVRISIAQPRLDHFDTWELPLTDLLGFGWVVKQAVAEIQAGGTFRPSESACRFCRGRAVCRARAEKNVELAFMAAPPANVVGLDDIAGYLKLGADIANWLNDLEEYALKECLAGHTVKGLKAVEGRSVRSWTDEKEALKHLQDNGYPESVLYERNPLSLAKIEKAVGKKPFNALMEKYITKKPGKPTLVPEDDKRPAITNQVSAAQAFENKKED